MALATESKVLAVLTTLHDRLMHVLPSYHEDDVSTETAPAAAAALIEPMTPKSPAVTDESDSQHHDSAADYGVAVGSDNPFAQPIVQSFVTPCLPSDTDRGIEVSRRTVRHIVNVLSALVRRIEELSATAARRCTAKLYQVMDAILIHCNESKELLAAVLCKPFLDPLIKLFDSKLKIRQSCATARNYVKEVAQLKNMYGKPFNWNLAYHLEETFAIEYVIDVLMPPAVCSSRYEAVNMTLWERKADFISTATGAKGFLSSFVKKATLGHLHNMITFGLYAHTRQRLKFYERLVQEGLVHRLVVALGGEVEPSLSRGSPSRAPSATTPTEDEVSAALDVLCLLSTAAERSDQPADFATDSSGPVTRSSTKKMPGSDAMDGMALPRDDNRVYFTTWASHKYAPQLVALAFDVLERPQTVSTKLTCLIQDKAVQFLCQCCPFGAAMLRSVVRGVDAAFDQVFCACIVQLLPVLDAVIDCCSTLQEHGAFNEVATKAAQEVTSAINHWCFVLAKELETMTARAARERVAQRQLIPYFRFWLTIRKQLVVVTSPDRSDSLPPATRASDNKLDTFSKSTISPTLEKLGTSIIAAAQQCAGMRSCVCITASSAREVLEAEAKNPLAGLGAQSASSSPLSETWAVPNASTEMKLSTPPPNEASQQSDSSLSSPNADDPAVRSLVMDTSPKSATRRGGRAKKRPREEQGTESPPASLVRSLMCCLTKVSSKEDR